MRKTIVSMGIFLSAIFFIHAETVTLTGTVTKAGTANGIAGVVVKVAKYDHLSATTDANGAFAINGATTSVQSPGRQPSPLQFVMRGNTIIFSSDFHDATGSVDIFSSDGKRKLSVRLNDLPLGKRSVTLPEFGSGINILRVTINGESCTRTVVSVGDNLFMKNEVPAINDGANFIMAKRMTTQMVDTLIAAKEGYKTKKVGIENYTKQNILISLDSSGETPGPCTRQALQAAAESYIEAQTAGDPSKMPLAAQVRYIQNLDTVAKVDTSIYKKALPVAFHRNFLDCDSCRTFSEVIVKEGGHPYIIGTRLRVVDGKITEVDAIVTDTGDWGFNVKVYYDSCTKQSWDTLTIAQRSTRQTLINAANAYGTIFEVPHTDTIPFGTPCSRVEGGMGTNNCHMGFPTGNTNHQLATRDFVVDTVMGTIDMFCYLVIGSIRAPDSHLIRMVNGKIRYVHTLTIWGN